MAREYRHIKQYEKEIMEMKAQGLTHREVGKRLGFERKQIREFIHRKNRNERKSAAGIITGPKGRPHKNGANIPPSIQQLSKVTQLQYEIARKDSHIKRLEMENELMRDFLSLTERK